MDETTHILKAGYNAFEYPSHPYRFSHPDRLAVMAALRGIPHADVERCRVLEIGCASGGNLIPMAEQLPESTFFGIDLAENQVNGGLDLIRKSALANIELRIQDLMEFSPSEWKFDFVIAHGVYSWVPHPVQKRLLEICRDHLSPNGLAFISYNAYPGWRANEMARDAMLFRARRSQDGAERAALGRQIIQLIASQAAGSQAYNETARSLEKLFAGAPDEHLLHDVIAPVNDARFLWQFTEEASAYGLVYVGDADAIPDPWLKISPAAREAIRGMSIDDVEREQYLDFLLGKTFHATVLCKSENHAAQISPRNRFSSLFAAGSPSETPKGSDEQGRPAFEYGDGAYKLKISDPGAIALFRQVRAAWPAAVPYAELLKNLSTNHPTSKPTPAEFLDRALDSLYKLGLMELWPRATTRIASVPGTHPRMTPRARLEAAHADRTCSLRHLPVQVDEAVRQLIPLLDGSRNKDELADELLRLAQTSPRPLWPIHREQINERLGVVLNLLAKMSLLVD
jgi:SAM-dependent methyltransferase